MKRITVDDVEHPPTISPASVVRPLGPALGTTDVAVNLFELAPGETFGFDYHRHRDQEELFYVLEGTVTFRTEDGDVAVAAGEVVRFAPGEFQLGRNAGDGPVRALAIGAPRDSTEIEYRRPCPDCGEETVQPLDVDREAAAIEITCSRCGSVVESLEFES
ncbi:MAG: cupin domain-containing protein [Halobacteriales archaeon]|nr:cupin domain-containing protein [Halobacteriales archaeon]